MSEFYLKVAGVTFEGRQRVIAGLKEGQALKFVPDPSNPYDSSAVKIVTLDGTVIGFVARDRNSQIFDNLINNRGEYQVSVSSITGGSFGANYGCNVKVVYSGKTYAPKAEKRAMSCNVCGRIMTGANGKCPHCGHNWDDWFLPNLMRDAFKGKIPSSVEALKKKLEIGHAFEHGNTVNKDLVSAAFWYELVAKDYSQAGILLQDVRAALTTEKREKSSLVQGKTIRVGDYITIGQYPYNAKKELRGLSWLVLDIEGDHLFVITKDCIDHVKFNEVEGDSTLTWETSSLRTWLNNEFLDSAFNDVERAAIVETPVVTMIQSAAQEITYLNTTDRVFVLSERETSGYCYTEQTRFAKATEYAKMRGADYDILEGRGWWWLRDSHPMVNMSPGISCVWFKGRIALDGAANEDASIRPAMWIDVQKLFVEKCNEQADETTNANRCDPALEEEKKAHRERLERLRESKEDLRREIEDIKAKNERIKREANKVPAALQHNEITSECAKVEKELKELGMLSFMRKKKLQQRLEMLEKQKEILNREKDKQREAILATVDESLPIKEKEYKELEQKIQELERQVN